MHQPCGKKILGASFPTYGIAVKRVMFDGKLRFTMFHEVSDERCSSLRGLGGFNLLCGNVDVFTFKFF